MGPGDHEIDAISIYQVSILGGRPRKLRPGAFRLDLSPDESLLVYMGMSGIIWLADSDGEVGSAVQQGCEAGDGPSLTRGLRGARFPSAPR